MTDTDGHLHRNTLPVGKMRPAVWMRVQTLAKELLNAPFLELVNKTSKPFVSSVSDCAAPRALFYDDRLLLVGEALTLYRPHTGTNFNQSASDCLQLSRVLRGEITIQRWEEEILRSRMTARLMAIAYGEFYQSGPASWKFISYLLRFILALISSRLTKLWNFVYSWVTNHASL